MHDHPSLECEEAAVEPAGGPALTAAQRARMERQRLRARSLQDARLVRHAHTHTHTEGAVSAVPAAVVDSGGGFLLEAAAAAAAAAAEATVAAVAAPAPLVDPAERPACLGCQRPIPHSFLLDTFEYPVCDDCRDSEGEHALVTRTEAKSQFLLKDCDLDLRPPPLPSLRRRNPHRGGADMRLYLRAQLLARALLVWGSAAALERERGARARGRERARTTHASRRLRALRMDVRSSLYERVSARHEHAYGPERLASAADHLYERACLECGHLDRYEKM